MQSGFSYYWDYWGREQNFPVNLAFLAHETGLNPGLLFEGLSNRANFLAYFTDFVVWKDLVDAWMAIFLDNVLRRKGKNNVQTLIF